MLNELTPRKALLISLLMMGPVMLRRVYDQFPDLLAARFENPDSYTRLVLLRDVLAGQGFQYLSRDNAPYGAYLHWSMVHTWAIQELAQGLMTFGMNRDAALLWAGGGLTVLSTILLAYFVISIVIRQGGRLAAVAASLTLASSLPLSGYAQLVQITHHVFMLVPLAAAAWCFLPAPAVHRAARPQRRLPFSPSKLGDLPISNRDLAGGGLLALALWISPETMPFVVALIGIRAAIRLQFHDQGLVWPTALGLMLLLCLGWLLDPPPPTFNAWALDHISYAWLSLGALLSILLVLSDILAARTLALPAKAAVLLAAAVLAAAIWLIAVPGALEGYGSLVPFAIKRHWMDTILEMQPARSAWEIVAWGVMPAISGLFLAGVAWRTASLWKFLLALATLAYTMLGLWHIRSGAGAAVLCALSYGLALCHLPAFTSIDQKGHPKAVQRQSTLLVLLPFVVSALALGLAGNFRHPGKLPPPSCVLSDIAAELNALPAGTVLLPLNLGPELLWRTGHRIVASNYHHNVSGLSDYFTLMRGSGPAAAQSPILEAREIRYLLACHRPQDGKGQENFQTMIEAGRPVPGFQGPEVLHGWNLYQRTP